MPNFTERGGTTSGENLRKDVWDKPSYKIRFFQSVCVCLSLPLYIQRK
jgi:hypothetical protein